MAKCNNININYSQYDYYGYEYEYDYDYNEDTRTIQTNKQTNSAKHNIESLH